MKLFAHILKETKLEEITKGVLENINGKPSKTEKNCSYLTEALIHVFDLAWV